MKLCLRTSSLLPVALLVLSVFAGCQEQSLSPAGSPISLSDVIAKRSSGVEVEGEGVVIKLLPDDREGDRHQRFIIRIASGETLLIAHNIDASARIDSLHQGDRISFRGEYEWNDRGGVVHWTHSDRRGRHAAGWLLHNGVKYD